MSTAKSRKTKPKAEGSTTRESASYFVSLSLQNLRCFGPETQTLDLSDGKGRPARWTILLGNNGTGKTTALQCLTLFGAFARPTIDNLYKSGQAIHWIRSGGLLTLTRAHNPYMARVVTDVIDLQGLASDLPGITKTLGLEPRGRGIGHEGDLSRSPACVGYGASRSLGVGVSPFPDSLNDDEYDDPVASLFDQDVKFFNAEQWLLNLDYSASKEPNEKSVPQLRLEMVKTLLLSILPDVNGFRFEMATKARRQTRVEFETPYGWVHLRQLSHGYQSLIAWVVDLASRMFDRYPDSPDPLAEPAVVLVDEIDLHLHPTWQRKVIGYLTERFPNTQFIVTAHSPLIVQAAADANLALLRREGDHVVIDNDVDSIKNWRVDQILTSELFGLPSAWPPYLDDLMKRRLEILTRPKLTKKSKAELVKIEEAIGVLPVGETADQMELMRNIEDTLKRLEGRLGPTE